MLLGVGSLGALVSVAGRGTQHNQALAELDRQIAELRSDASGSAVAEEQFAAALNANAVDLDSEERDAVMKLFRQARSSVRAPPSQGQQRAVLDKFQASDTHNTPTKF